MSLATMPHNSIYDEGYELVATEPARSIGYGVVPSFKDQLDFEQDLQRWMEDTMFDSLPHMMKAHQSYAAIVGRGEKAVPLIAAELRRAPSFLFLALEEITGANPVPGIALGRLQATVNAWLTWLQR